jgi:hypothetical protein
MDVLVMGDDEDRPLPKLDELRLVLCDVALPAELVHS